MVEHLPFKQRVGGSSPSGPTSMNIYGIFIGLGIYIGISQFQNTNTQIAKNKEDLFVFCTVMIAIIGARLYHVFDQWSYYSNNLLQIINIPAGGLGIFGAIVSASIYIIIYSLRNHLSPIKILNEIAPCMAIGQSIGRVGNYFNTEIFGIPTYIEFGQYIPYSYRPSQYQQFSYFHPVWLYESILMFFAFIIIRKAKNPFPLYLISYGFVRFSLEFLRFDTWQIYNVKIGQIISLLMIIIGFRIHIKNSSKSK